VESTFELVAVAFLRSTGGEVRVLLAVDRDGEQLFDGEPALLASHRPGRDAGQLQLEGPERVASAVVERVAELARIELARLVEEAFDEVGTFDGERMLGRSVRICAPRGLLDV
jgi:hypothetical protein